MDNIGKNFQYLTYSHWRAFPFDGLHWKRKPDSDMKRSHHSEEKLGLPPCARMDPEEIRFIALIFRTHLALSQ